MSSHRVSPDAGAWLTGTLLLALLPFEGGCEQEARSMKLPPKLAEQAVQPLERDTSLTPVPGGPTSQLWADVRLHQRALGLAVASSQFNRVPRLTRELSACMDSLEARNQTLAEHPDRFHRRVADVRESIRKLQQFGNRHDMAAAEIMVDSLHEQLHAVGDELPAELLGLHR